MAKARFADRNIEMPGRPVQLCRNYIVVDEEGQDDWPTKHIPRPGLKLFATVGTGPIRGGGFQPKVISDLALVISDDEAYKVTSAGSPTKIGDLNTSYTDTLVDLTFCRNEAVVVDTGKAYKVTASATAFISDADLPTVSSVTYLNGLTIFGTSNNDRFYWSALLDSASVDALDFATAERKPDRLIKALADNDELWLFGETGSEAWAATTDSDLPFQRIDGVDLQKGCAARNAVVAIDNAIIWPGHDNMVYRLDGYSPIRISDDDLDTRLKSLTAAQRAELKAFGFIWNGRTLYVLTSPGNWTVVIDIRTGRCWRWNVFGRDDMPIAFYMYAFGKHLVGDGLTNKIYELDGDTYEDAGYSVIERIVTAQVAIGQRATCESIGLYCSRGTGSLTDEAEAMVSYSDDDGLTFSAERQIGLGKLGERLKAVVARGFGSMRPPNRIFKVKITDAFHVVLRGMKVNEREY